jgi:Carboxypeptidase regulatory-like domain
MRSVLRFARYLPLFLAVLMVIGPSPASAQVASGSISGSVSDPQSSAVPDATVSAVNQATNREVATTTDSSGQFRLSLLEPGKYRVEISKQGFRKVVFENLEVSVGADRGLGTVKMEIGEVSATVEVSSAPPLIESTEAQVTNAYTPQDISTFAGVLENQGLDSLALTVPGVVNTRDLFGFANSNGVTFSVNGLRGRNNDQQLDGQNNNDNSVTGPALFLSDPEFVGEYKIITGNFGAEYGRNSGSVVNIITKSGTNVVHGSVYGTESNSALNALSSNQKAFEGLKKPARFNDEFTGGTLGGPIWTDHVFFFGGFDNEIVSQRQVFSSGALTPTPAGIATMVACYGNTPSLQALQKFGPYAIAGGNPTPLSPALMDLANCPGVEFGGIERTLPTGSKSYNFPIKIDIQTAKNHFYGRYLFNRTTFFNADSFVSGSNSPAAEGYPNNQPSFAQDYAFSWSRTISTRMSNEFRATYGRSNVQFGGNTIGTLPQQGGLDQAVANVIFNSTQLLPFGPATNAPQGRIVNTYQGQDNWSYLLGRHSLKAGVNFTYQRSPNKFLPNDNGQWRFTSWDTYGSDTPNRIRIASGNPVLDFREKDTFLYFGDDFKVKNNLTLNLGITWSYYGQPANLFHDRTVKNQASSTPLWNPALPASVTTFPSIPAPNNSWGPSVGFAWTPSRTGRLTGNGKTVVRGGYRLSYDPPFYNIYLNISSAAPNVLLNSLTGATAAANPLSANPVGPANRAQLAPFLLTGVFDPRSFNETSISPNFGPQKVHEWSLGIQRELRPDAVFEVRYVGNHALNLFQSINGNPEIAGLAASFPNLVPSGDTPCTAPQIVLGPGQTTNPALGRVNCAQGVVRERTNTGYSDYNGVQTELRVNNLWHQLTMKAAYTFSKTTDNATEIFASGGAGSSQAFSQSQVNFTGQEHGISGIDIPHNFSITVTEDLPMFRAQHGLIGHVLGGWVVSGNYFIASGQPYTASQSGLNFGSGGGASQPTLVSPYDNPFNAGFVGADGALRPFLGSSSAPVTSVGIYAGDACNFFGVTGTEPICTMSPTSLVSLNGLNSAASIATYQPVVVTNKQVRFIANTAQADAAFGTPFGNVGRNTLRDYWTNIGNFALFKNFKIKERTTFTFHMSMQNVFNHPNFASIDPFIDDAGLATEFTGFANPRVQNGGLVNLVGTPGRTIRFGLAFHW